MIQFFPLLRLKLHAGTWSLILEDELEGPWPSSLMCEPHHWSTKWTEPSLLGLLELGLCPKKHWLLVCLFLFEKNLTPELKKKKPIYILLLLFSPETEFVCVLLVVLELALYTRLAMNSQRCLTLPLSTRIKGAGRHHQTTLDAF